MMQMYQSVGLRIASTSRRSVNLIHRLQFSSQAADSKPSMDAEEPEKPLDHEINTDQTEREAIEKRHEELENNLKSTHHKLLLKYADAENKRRDRLADLKKKDSSHISKFGDKVSGIYRSLEEVCTIAQERAKSPGAEEKVKSFSEGLFMTRDIMKGILSKHNIESNSK
jgi:molecular chaperone GrpE (heat shock protein)